jgi:methenyltetrahydromethanopterin cyclohydrolase
MELELNKKSCQILEELRNIKGVESTEHRIDERRVVVIDLGVAAKIPEQDQSVTGIKVAEASMGGLGRVQINGNILETRIPKHPGIATISCQLAGWAIDISGKKKLGSGPARIPAGKPGKLIDAAGYMEKPKEAALILETDTLPDKESCKRILDQTGTEKLIIAAFKEDGKTGLINVLARIAEVGIYRLHNIGYDIKKIRSAKGSVPIPKNSKDLMHESNDAIIYQGTVTIEVDGWDPALTGKAVSRASNSYGKKFKQIFQEAGGDFYKIDPDIFAPAKITVTDLKDGKSYTAGELFKH